MLMYSLEHQHEAHDLEQHEYEPIVVFLQKLEEVAHSRAFISSGTPRFSRIADEVHPVDDQVSG